VNGVLGVRKSDRPRQGSEGNPNGRALRRAPPEAFRPGAFPEARGAGGWSAEVRSSAAGGQGAAASEKESTHSGIQRSQP